MDVSILQRQFAQIGARLKVLPENRRSRSIAPRGVVTVDIGQDRDGEFFSLTITPRADPEIAVVHQQRDIRHLLLMTRDSAQGDKHKFLCGHDERAWFVAAVPEVSGVASVKSAMEALKPGLVRGRQASLNVRPKERNRRRNAAFVRQGEWFFIPQPNLAVDRKLVLENEPLRRGGGKPHMVEFLYRTGGETVYVTQKYPNGLTENQHQKLVSRNPDARHWQWAVLRRNPQVYVRGKVRHADHKTIDLSDWHQVLMNTETQSAAMRHVAFID